MQRLLGAFIRTRETLKHLQPFQCHFVSWAIRAQAQHPHFAINVLARAMVDDDDIHARAIGPRTGAARSRAPPSSNDRARAVERWRALGETGLSSPKLPDGPRGPQYRSMTAREAYKRSLDGPGRPQDGPRSLKTAQECPKWDVAHVPCMRGCMLCMFSIFVD